MSQKERIQIDPRQKPIPGLEDYVLTQPPLEKISKTPDNIILFKQKSLDINEDDPETDDAWHEIGYR